MTNNSIKFLQLKKPRYFLVFDFLRFLSENIELSAIERGVIYITVRQVSESARIPKTTVIRALSWLRKHKYISILSVKRVHKILISADYL